MPMLKQDQINHLNSCMSPGEIGAVVNSLPTEEKKRKKERKKPQDQMGLAGNSIRTAKKS